MGTSHAMTTLIVNVVPQFSVKPPKKIERYHGHSVTLNCSADLITSTNYHLVKMQRKNSRGTYTYEGRSDKD